MYLKKGAYDKEEEKKGFVSVPFIFVCLWLWSDWLGSVELGFREILGQITPEPLFHLPTNPASIHQMMA